MGLVWIITMHEPIQDSGAAIRSFSALVAALTAGGSTRFTGTPTTGGIVGTASRLSSRRSALGAWLT